MCPKAEESTVLGPLYPVPPHDQGTLLEDLDLWFKEVLGGPGFKSQLRSPSLLCNLEWVTQPYGASFNVP